VEQERGVSAGPAEILDLARKSEVLHYIMRICRVGRLSRWVSCGLDILWSYGFSVPCF